MRSVLRQAPLREGRLSQPRQVVRMPQRPDSTGARRRPAMPEGRKPSLSPEEARELHQQALVIDTQQPPITSGIVFTPGMREALSELHSQGRTRAEAGPVLE